MAASRERNACLLNFAVGTLIFIFSCTKYLSTTYEYIWNDFLPFLVVTYSLIVNTLIWFQYRDDIKLYKVAVRAGGLGILFGSGFIISFSHTTWVHFGWYAVFLSFFHWSEYCATAVTNPGSLTLDSYLLDHSLEYKLAALASWIEFGIEWLIFPGLKQLRYVSLIGVLIVIAGEILRKTSMFTAKTNFNHYVQYMKQQGHTLVTTGVYSICRHPSYVGWFSWSIGTQIILCNPLCLVGYTIVSWRFFRERIYEEEIYLLNFFGEDYLDYQKKVGTGLPFIRGYRGEL